MSIIYRCINCRRFLFETHFVRLDNFCEGHCEEATLRDQFNKEMHCIKMKKRKIVDDMGQIQLDILRHCILTNTELALVALKTIN